MRWAIVFCAVGALFGKKRCQFCCAFDAGFTLPSTNFSLSVFENSDFLLAQPVYGWEQRAK
jgi:hypothetical protein